MHCGIYKITNLVNSKIYIGQSKHIERRWTRHKRDSRTIETPLYYAIRKHGLENFAFEILDECLVSELNSKEIFWIDFYKSNSKENGYNISSGGNNPVGQVLSLEDVSKISNLLNTTKLGNKKIAKMFNVSENVISGINTGLCWRRDIKYPIRERIKIERFCSCGKLISSVSKKCFKCHSISKRIERPSQEILKLKISSLGFKGTGVEYGVSDNAIRKWCQEYQMSTKIGDYK